MEKEKTVFLKVFGDSPLLRVLDFLVVHEEFDYSMTDIANLAEIGYSTLKLFWNKLEKDGIVIQTRIVGKAKMYKLNLNNPIVKKFKDFYWYITKIEVHKSLSKENTKETIKLRH
jgi:hypothetical protein